MTKKILKICSVALALVTLFSVSGCKNKKESTQSSIEEVEVLEKSGYKIVKRNVGGN